MADLADMIQKLSFYQNGGQDPGTTNADHFNQGFGMVNNIVSSVLAQKKAMLENKKATAEIPKIEADTLHTGAETKKLDIGNQTLNESNLSEIGLKKAQAGALNNKGGGGVHRLVSKSTGKVIAEYPGSPGSSDTFTLIDDAGLPTYKKSEILAMSPEDRALLGKYKVVDDTTPNKNEDDNQTVDSILSGINRLAEIRKTMGTGSRVAATVPGVAQAGKLFSAPLASWETEKNLLSQRLGKLVEKNRMSDDDRKFYLSQFSSPVAKDPAFDANIAGLRTAVEAMKKETPGAGPGGSGLLQNLINKHK